MTDETAIAVLVALEILVETVDPSPDLNSPLEPYFRGPVQLARAAIAKAKEDLG